MVIASFRLTIANPDHLSVDHYCSDWLLAVLTIFWLTNVFFAEIKVCEKKKRRQAEESFAKRLLSFRHVIMYPLSPFFEYSLKLAIQIVGKNDLAAT